MTRFLRVQIAGIAIGVGFAFVSPTPVPATDVFTDPVGFITLTIAGGSASGQFSYLGLGMTQLVAAQGKITSVAGTTLGDSSSVWTNNQFNGTGNAYFIELTSGTGAGITDDIVATDGSGMTITTANDVSAFVTAGQTTYRIRKHWTLGGVFGPNDESGLQTGLSASSADDVLVFDPFQQSWTTYYYRTSAGWRAATNVVLDASNAVLYGDQGVAVKHKNATPISIKLVGAVKTGQTSIPVEQNFNLVGVVYPVTNLTLAASGLYTGDPTTGLAPGLSASAADVVLIWNGVNGYDIYYYRTSAGWRVATNVVADASGTVLPMGQSVFIKRGPGHAAFNWVVPQPVF